MSKVTGTNALVYIGGTPSAPKVAPQRNSWSLDMTRELIEARVFQDAAGEESWVENIGSFKSWSGSVSGYYDDANEDLVAATVNSTSRNFILLYEDRSVLTRYWYGLAWFEMSQDTSADGVIELNVDFTGDGRLYRFAA